MLASIFLPNFLRIVAIVFTIAVLVSMPRAVSVATHGHASKYAPWLVLGFELLVLSKFAGLIDRWNKSLIWYGAPLTLVAILIIAIYIYKILTVARRDKNNHASGS